MASSITTTDLDSQSSIEHILEDQYVEIEKYKQMLVWETLIMDLNSTLEINGTLILR